MAKVMLFVFVALLTLSLIMAATKDGCGRHGDDCQMDSQCCGTNRCRQINPTDPKTKSRCQVQITAEELMKQRDKILRRKGTMKGL